MLWGFVKKFLIADSCAPYVNAIFSHPVGLSSPYIVIGTLLFGIQIYCDFSGYIDIALGAAELIGLHLPQNFLRPYLSKSPTEFWRRWNITLSSFIRDYIYIPLGGNRCGKIQTYLNLEISMILCGLWHGAAWNFIIWGGYHGLLLSAHKFLAKYVGYLPRLLSNCNGNFKFIIKIFITQYFIFLGWIMFRIGNLSDMIYCVSKYIFFDFNFSKQPITLWGFTRIISIIDTWNIYIWFLLSLITFTIFIWVVQSDFIMKKIISLLYIDWTYFLASLPIRYWFVYVTVMILLLLCCTPSESPVFIYFQF